MTKYFGTHKVKIDNKKRIGLVKSFCFNKTLILTKNIDKYIVKSYSENDNSLDYANSKIISISKESRITLKDVSTESPFVYLIGKGDYFEIALIQSKKILLEQSLDYYVMAKYNFHNGYRSYLLYTKSTSLDSNFNHLLDEIKALT